MSILQPRGSGADGLSGEWLSLDDLEQIDLFRSKKRALRVRLAANFAPHEGRREPGVKAAVKREYQPGDVICRAGEYGSTAFLILSGRVETYVPRTATPAPVAGRTRRSLAALKRVLSRHAAPVEPDDVSIGHVSAYGTIRCDAPPPEQTLGPGDVFGVDTCINFYPRELTAEAREPCVVIEMLRSVLDSIRESGEAGGRVDELYRRTAVRNQLRLSPLFRGIDPELTETLLAGAELLTPDSDTVRGGVLYGEGELADSLYLVRAGTIRLTRRSGGGDAILEYLSRGAAFGVESVVPPREKTPLLLKCVSHPEAIPAREIAGALTIGRSAGCDVVTAAENRGVSKRHCRLEERHGDFYLVDLDSVNYTLLNGERIREAIVRAGDRIGVVDYVFEVARGAVDSTAEGRALRPCTASGLDNFEVIKIPAQPLRDLARREAAIFARLRLAARSLEIAAGRAAPEANRLAEAVELNLYNSQNVLLIDLDSCTRCDECVRACADAHGGITRFTRDGPRFGKYLVTMACRSCTDPKCMVGCPVGSIRREASLEIRIEDWCIGCQRCANQCPFGAINMVELETLPATAPAASPPVVMRATVCDLCAGYDGPSCVYACPHDAAVRLNPSILLPQLPEP